MDNSDMLIETTSSFYELEAWDSDGSILYRCFDGLSAAAEEYEWQKDRAMDPDNETVGVKLRFVRVESERVLVAEHGCKKIERKKNV